MCFLRFLRAASTVFRNFTVMSWHLSQRSPEVNQLATFGIYQPTDDLKFNLNGILTTKSN